MCERRSTAEGSRFSFRDTGTAGFFVKGLLCLISSAANASGILAQGFRDGDGSYGTEIALTGVWVSEIVLDENEGACGDAVLQIEAHVSKRDLSSYEVKEGGKPYREWCFPARLINKGKITKTR